MKVSLSSLRKKNKKKFHPRKLNLKVNLIQKHFQWYQGTSWLGFQSRNIGDLGMDAGPAPIIVLDSFFHRIFWNVCKKWSSYQRKIISLKKLLNEKIRKKSENCSCKRFKVSRNFWDQKPNLPTIGGKVGWGGALSASRSLGNALSIWY